MGAEIIKNTKTGLKCIKRPLNTISGNLKKLVHKRQMKIISEFKKKNKFDIELG